MESLVIVVVARHSEQTLPIRDTSTKARNVVPIPAGIKSLIVSKPDNADATKGYPT